MGRDFLHFLFFASLALTMTSCDLSGDASPKVVLANITDETLLSLEQISSKPDGNFENVTHNIRCSIGTFLQLEAQFDNTPGTLSFIVKCTEDIEDYIRAQFAAALAGKTLELTNCSNCQLIFSGSNVNDFPWGSPVRAQIYQLGTCEADFIFNRSTAQVVVTEATACPGTGPFRYRFHYRDGDLFLEKLSSEYLSLSQWELQ